LKKPTDAVTHEVALTYGLPSPLPTGWMARFGHLSVTVERSECPAEKPGRMSIELSVKPLDLNQK
jgi:hypothetical protein